MHKLSSLSNLPSSTPDEASHKKSAYIDLTAGTAWKQLQALADIKLAPFFTVKNPTIPIATEQVYRHFLNNRLDVLSDPIARHAQTTANERKFFHWCIEFAEVMQAGGFDCFLGNPPFLGGQRLSGTFGKDYLDYLRFAYAPAGAIDFVGYFVRRNYNLLKPKRALGTLSTNTLAQGGTREGSLEVIETQGGTIIMAVRSRPWPGVAA